MRKALPALFPFLLCIGILAGYYHSLSGPFVLDDEPNIVRNPYIRMDSLDRASLGKVFSPYQPSASRPAANLSFALNYLVNGLDPAGYRAVNILIHFLAACAVFRLFAWYFRKTGRPEGNALRPALFGSLLWALNPVQTGAVTYIVQRMTSLCTLFFVVSLLAYLYGRDRMRGGAARGSVIVTLSLFAASFLLFLLALLTKQIAVVLPLVILLHEFFFFQGRTGEERLRKKKYLCLAALLLAVGAGILLAGTDLREIIARGYAQRDFTMTERLLTQPRVVVRYLSLFLLPLPSRLNLLYDLQASRSLLDPATTLPSVLAILCLAAGACLAARKLPLAALGMMWTLAALALESTFLPLELIFEHRFYLPSIGFSLTLTALAHRMSESIRLPKRLAAVLGTCVACLLLVMTYQRNQDWRSLVSFYEDAVRKSPNLVRAVNGLGVAYMRAGRPEDAEKTYLRGLRLDPGNVVLLANLYTLYTEQGRHEPAEPYLERLERAFTDGRFRCNESSNILLLAEVLVRQRRFDKVIFFLEGIGKCGKKNDVYYDNLGLSYSRVGNHARAAENFARAVELDPENPYYLFSLSRSCLQAGDGEQALAAWNRLQGLTVPDDLRPHVKKLADVLRIREERSCGEANTVDERGADRPAAAPIRHSDPLRGRP